MQRHFSGDPWQRLHQEVGCSHPGLDPAKRVLDRLAPLTHLIRMLVEPALHRFENVLMFPSGDPSRADDPSGPTARATQCLTHLGGPT